MTPPLIRLRLTALYAGTIAAILLASTFVLWRVVTATSEREFTRSLDRGLVLARGTFGAEVAEYRTIEATLAHVAGEIGVPDRETAFIDPGGRVAVVARSPLGGDAPLAPPVVVRTAPLDPALAPGWTVRISASAAEERARRRRLLAWTFASIPALALLAVAAGWLVTGRALRPVARMADATGRIAPGSGMRLPVAEPHDELGRLGGRFNALLDRLDDALLQQRRFLADAEHELRTPVARVRTRVEAALAHPPGDGDRQALEEAARELRRTSALLDELLLLARADAGAPAGPRERLYLDDVAMDAMNQWRGDAARAGVTLVVDRIEEAPVVAERALLVRAVGILLDNAIRYTPAGGRVALRVHPGPSVAVLEVSDTGIGIPLGERERVLQRFHRGAQARAMAPGGSGLGLSIAHWVVERHGGRLELLPKAGGGTLVRITLPSLARPSGIPAVNVGQVPDDEALRPAER